jgi:hypothetical protein
VASCFKQEFKMDSTVLDTVLFFDFQAVFSKSEIDIQRAVNKLENTENSCIVEISTMKKKVISGGKPYKK